MRTSPIGLLSALVVSVGLVALPGAGRADTYQFTSDHCGGTGTCLTGQTSGGTVTVTQSATDTLSFDVQLANGNKFVNTGFDASFGFNLAGISTITYAGISSGFALVTTQAAGSLHMD